MPLVSAFSLLLCSPNRTTSHLAYLYPFYSSFCNRRQRAVKCLNGMLDGVFLLPCAVMPRNLQSNP
jgi:hypothetical protein